MAQSVATRSRGRRRALEFATPPTAQGLRAARARAPRHLLLRSPPLPASPSTRPLRSAGTHSLAGGGRASAEHRSVAWRDQYCGCSQSHRRTTPHASVPARLQGSSQGCRHGARTRLARPPAGRARTRVPPHAPLPHRVTCACPGGGGGSPPQVRSGRRCSGAPRGVR